MKADTAYFKTHQYRHPSDRVVHAYVEPKLSFMRKQGCFTGERVRILDVGCGNGTFSYHFSRYHADVVACDYTWEQLEANPCGKKFVGTAYQLPFRDNRFEVVFEANLLHHLDDPSGAVREMKRCSAGYIVLIEPNRYNPLMSVLALAVAAERGVWSSSLKRWVSVFKESGIDFVGAMTTGMISQQNTPAFLVPFLKLFDGDFFLGEYVVIVGKKPQSQGAGRE